MDAWLLKSIGDNWMTIYLVMTLLKGIAIITPWAADDKIITMLSNAYSAIRTGKIPNEIE